MRIGRITRVCFVGAALMSLAPFLPFSVAAAEVPVVREVDVVVVGGTSAGVGAAIAAHALGARVFLIAPRPYLGEDIAGTMRVVRDPADDDREPPYRAIFAPSEPDATGLATETTPFRVKRALDEALLGWGVPYLTGSAVCDVLRDAEGHFAGVVMANRSGRQVVKAKILIDATPRALAARRAGGITAPFPKGVYKFRRVVLSGEAPSGAGVVWARPISEPRQVTAPNPLDPPFPESFEARLWECELEIPMADGSARSFAAAEQSARDMTFTPTLVDAADTLTLMDAPDRFETDTTVATWKNSESIDLGCFRVRHTEDVFVLGPLAGLTSDAAAAFRRPGVAQRVGARIGRVAAARTKQLAKAQTKAEDDTALTVAPTPGARPLGGTLGEVRGELPDYLVNAKGTLSLADDLPTLAEVDTLVVGAGTGGAPAAIAAARQGAKTLVIDFLYIEGGVMTDGLIGYYCHGNRVGFTTEIDAGVRTTGRVFSQAKSEWFRREQRKAGAEVWFGASANGVVVRDGHLIGVVVVMADGTRGLVTCRNAVDATGSAALAAMAGEETEFITDDELSVQGAGQARRTPGAVYANSDIGFVDDADAADAFYFALRSRLSLPNATWDQAQVLGTRERRRLVGAFYMSVADVINGRTYPDVVVRTLSNFDTHGQTKDDAFFIEDPGHEPMFVNLPYRCFLPKRLDGLLVVGLGISAHRDAMPILRMQPDVQNQGYVAGVASVMAVKGGTTVRGIDIPALQRHLVEKGVLRPEDLGQKDSFPLPDAAFDKAVKDLADGYRGLAVLLTDRARALPRLRVAYAAAPSSGAAKLVYAHVLALMGADDGADVLTARFASSAWDEGWNFRGMDQFNRSVSWMDSYAIALGNCRAVQAVPALMGKARQLDAASDYSHFRAVSRALEAIGDSRGAAVLVELLRCPGVGGRWQTIGVAPPAVPGYANKAGDWERTLALRELCVARALFRLGDSADALGRRTLERYASDPRRIYATHAKLVLAEGERKRNSCTWLNNPKEVNNEDD